MRRWVLAGVLVGLAGVAWVGADPVRLATAKREVRLALGLPKAWVRGVNSDVAGYERLECPGDAIVVVTGGQSNAANALSEPLAGDRRAAALMMWDGVCYRLRDPVLGASGRGGSLWTELGVAIWRRTGRPAVFVHGAVGGTQLGDWLDARSGYLARLLGQVKAAKAAGLPADYVLWVQGETDAAAFVAPAEYVAQMKALVARVDASGAVPVGVPWVVYRSTRCKTRPGNGPAIDAAVADWARRERRIVLGPWASQLGEAERWDGCHFNARGRRALVAATMAVLEPGLAAEGPAGADGDPSPPASGDGPPPSRG